MTYKMFVCDLDGTLLDDQKLISNENLKAIKALEENGIKFIVATGRTKYMLEDFLDIIENKNPVIWSNGGAVSDHIGDNLWANQLPVEDSRKLIELADEHRMNYAVYTLNGVVGPGLNGRIQSLKRYNAKVNKDHKIPLKLDNMLYNNLHHYDIIKFSFSVEDHRTLSEFKTLVNTRIKSVNGVFSDATLLDVTRQDVSKGVAVLKLAQSYNIQPEEIAVMGDNENDLSMLEICGLPLTLENGIDSLKQIAKHITKDNNSSGVAYAINNYIL